MPYSNPFNIPDEILQTEEYEDDISILIGENGSGKSTMLNDIADLSRARGAKVIAIANTIHDKFKARGPKYHTLRASSGKQMVKKTLKAALLMLNDEDNRRFNVIAETLRYINFDETIGLRLDFQNNDWRSSINNSRFTTPPLTDEMMYVLDRFDRDRKMLIDRGDRENIIPVNLSKSNFYDLRENALLGVLRFEKELRKLKIIKDVEIFLRRNGRYIPVNSGSSGELTLITSMVYLMTVIEYRSVLLIDEPENSLHPKWQAEYVRMITNLIYLYRPKIVIATHSPLLISSAEIATSNIKIFKGLNGNFTRMENTIFNMEKAYIDFFDVTTPENRYLSEDIAKKMNQLAEGEIEFSEFQHIVGDLSANAIDENQKAVLDNVIELGRKIVDNR